MCLLITYLMLTLPRILGVVIVVIVTVGAISTIIGVASRETPATGAPYWLDGFTFPADILASGFGFIE